MTTMTITELRRVGANVLEETPVKFVWDAKNHSMIQDTVDLELKVNTTREMPAGAQEPVEQVMSVEWTEQSFHGEWKDQWAGQGFAEKTRVEFSQMCGRVPLVRLEIGPHSLTGLITKFSVKWRTIFECGYGFTLSIHRNETIGQFGATATTPKSAVNFAQRIQDQRDSETEILGVLRAADAVPFISEDFINATNNFDDLTSAVDNAEFACNAVAFESVLLDASSLIDKTQHKLLAIAAAFAGIRTQAQQSMADVQELVSSDVIAYDDVVATLRFEEWTRTQRTECMKMIGQARAAEIDARDRASRRPRGVHRVRRGDTLDRISMKWYGTPDSSRLIRDANNLHSIVLDEGVDLIIPDVSR